MPDGVGRNKPHLLKIFAEVHFRMHLHHFPHYLSNPKHLQHPFPPPPPPPPRCTCTHVLYMCTSEYECLVSCRVSMYNLSPLTGVSTTWTCTQSRTSHMTSQNPSVHGLDFTSNQAQDVISDQLEELYLTTKMCTLTHEPVRLFIMIYKADVMVHVQHRRTQCHILFIANNKIIYKQNYEDKDRT